MKTFKLIIIAVGLSTLASCGHSYVVRSLATDQYIYMDGSQIGNARKEGDTIHLEGPQRVDSVTVVNATFTGVVVSVDKKN